MNMSLLQITSLTIVNPTLYAMTSIILIITGILFVLIITSILFNCNSYSNYRKTYESLPTLKFYSSNEMLFTHKWGEPESDFMVTLSSNCFIFKNNSFLCNDIYILFDPYALYWLIKFRRWFKKNVEITNLEKF